MWEEKIKEHDPDFYEAIKPHVNTMPDFRPHDTLKNFKVEPQNNWRLIYQELESIGMNNEHMDLLSVINQGKEKELKRYVYNDRLISEFFFSYPALTWLMLKVSSRDVIVPLLITQGLYLNDIPFNEEYIEYIRDLKTAKQLRLLYSDIINDENVANENPLTSGHFYWLFAHPYNKLFNIVPDINEAMENIATNRNIEIMRIFLSSPGDYEVVHHSPLHDMLQNAIYSNFIEGVAYLLKNFKWSKKSLFYSTYYALTLGNSGISEMLLNILPQDFPVRQWHLKHSLLRELPPYDRILSINDKDYAEVIMTHSRIKEIKDHVLDPDVFMDLIRINNVGIVQASFQYYFPHLLLFIDDILDTAIILRRKKILKIILSHSPIEETARTDLIDKAKQIVNEKQTLYSSYGEHYLFSSQWTS